MMASARTEEECPYVVFVIVQIVRVVMDKAKYVWKSVREGGG